MQQQKAEIRHRDCVQNDCESGNNRMLILFLTAVDIHTLMFRAQFPTHPTPFAFLIIQCFSYFD